MNIEVVDRPSVRVAYRRHTGPFGEHLIRFWRGSVAPWMAEHGLLDCPRYGVSLDDPANTPPERCRYDACVELPPGLSVPDAPERNLPGGSYATAPFKGTSSQMGESWRAFMRDCLARPDAHLDPSRRPFEHYPRGATFDVRSGMFTCRLCLPLTGAAAMSALAGLRIEAAQPGDAPEILALQRLAYQSEARLYDDWDLPPLTQTLDSLREEIGGARVLKAVAGGRIAGSVRARLIDGTCHVGRLIVDPQLQGRGIGTRLMEAIEAEFPAALRFELFTGSRSSGNLRLYERLGYRRLREQVVSPAVTLVFMEKPR